MARLFSSLISLSLIIASPAMAETTTPAAPPAPAIEVKTPPPPAAEKKPGAPDSPDLSGLPILPPQDVNFHYKAEGKRDPFTSPLEEIKKEEEAGNQDNPRRDREPLEAFNMESLKLVGIMRFTGRMSALIEDPNGVAYSLQVGNYLGTNEGRILTIEENHVELVEKAPSPTDKNATRTTIMTLHEESE